MIEMVLIGVIVLLCGLLVWEKREGRLEKNKLINALLAKNAQDLASLDLIDKTEVKQVEKQPDLIPAEDLNDKEFKEVISGQQ